MENIVAIVTHVSECDVREITWTASRMPYRDALAVLKRIPYNRRKFYDLCSVMPDGTLGRYVSWSV
jgi:hypothetical protein